MCVITRRTHDDPRADAMDDDDAAYRTHDSRLVDAVRARVDEKKDASRRRTTHDSWTRGHTRILRKQRF